MSCERIKGEYVFICDDCDDVLEVTVDDFLEAVEKMKAEGWHATKDRRGYWTHACPDCQ